MAEDLHHDERSAGHVRTLIVDCRESSRRLMRTLLDSVPDFEVVAEAACAADARARLSELRPDLLLMEVAIPEFRGVELVRELEDPPAVIFVTEHPEYAVPAFEVGAVDYLVKPLRQRRFIAGVLRAQRRIAEARISRYAARIAGAAVTLHGRGRIEGGSRPTGPSDHLKIRIRRRMFWLNVADIAWIQGASQYSRIHARSGEFLLARSLSSLECELDPSRFFRIHRSAIVNARYVQEIRTNGDGRYNVSVHGGPVLPLGRSRREILGKLFEGVGRSAAPLP